MAETRLGAARLASIVGLSALTLGIGLGGSGRLTYHEAFVAQAARELIDRGAVLVPTIDGQPWLEKPPLAFWLVALAGKVSGEVTELVARAPSAVAATLLALGVAVFAARRFGPDVGRLAGLVQATTFWLVVRGRLAEADILLACLVTWSMVAFDRLRARDPGAIPLESPPSPSWRWAFFGALGATALVKGLGFGAVLVGSSVATVVIWDRDRSALKALGHAKGWALAAVVALTWPVLVAWRLPAAVSLWALHVTDRLASHPEHFIGGPRWQYGPAVLGQALPWTPLALVGAWPSMLRAIRGRGGVDRLLWAWAVVPVLVLSSATVKNAHYAIHALPPMSVWAALGLVGLGRRLIHRGWSPDRVRRAAVVLFVALGLGCGLGHLGLGPRFDRRGPEWAWTERIGRTLDPSLPLVFLYEDWDRKPYPTPFGPVPHDWAVRLFYLRRPASWRQGVDDLAARPPTPYALLGRDRDLLALRKLGRVQTLERGPSDRFDREFTLFRVTPPALR
jgi:4-amino-4-deoxy-L-arabinose transferase-like glycosyltransferase